MINFLRHRDGFPYTHVRCDGCLRILHESFIETMDSREDTERHLQLLGWKVRNGKHYCEQCKLKYGTEITAKKHD